VDSTEAYMERAFELARLGMTGASPNPMVGCLIVHNDEIIGEGFHQVAGGPHAEVNAINDVENKELLKDATVYVTLEPCSHHGKTPPCADLLAKYQVKKVVIANVDPNPLVAGKGIDIMRKAGIEVETGIMVSEGLDLNKRFFKAIQQQIPYIILKWAQTADGFIARENFDSKWISNKYSRKLVHKWRAEEDSILIGKNTARYDNPSLNVRHWQGRNPLRIVLDHELELEPYLNVFDGAIPTICYNTQKSEVMDNLEFIQLPKSDFIQALVSDLHKREVRSILVEGGANTLNTFIESGIWDEARVFTAPECFGAGVKAPQLINAVFDGKEDIMGDSLAYFKRR
jgi:diaminohydroxyphosphoribosylaminopyrimidine deaminase/5-amino-6-(5-phosphoribosylamino)uracil reductase